VKKKKSNKILFGSTKKPNRFHTLKEEQYEDIALGYMMDKVKTGETVSRSSVKKKLIK
jgi:hypothetical protein